MNFLKNTWKSSVPATTDETVPDTASFVELSDGITHYERRGSATDPLVVLVHGLTTSMFVWDEQMNALLRSGYQVLRYDLFGRGLSDRPKRQYDASFFDRQLKELLEALGVDRPVVLAGLSLGGAICVTRAAEAPRQTRGLFLVAPAGLRERMPWWYYAAVYTGLLDLAEYGLGTWFWKWIGPRNLTGDPEKQAKARRHMCRQLEFDGFHQALVSTIRHGPVYGLETTYQKVGRQDYPVRVVWSREDGVVPSSLRYKLESAIPRARVELIRDATHAANYDRPEAVNPILLEFLGRLRKNKRLRR